MAKTVMNIGLFDRGDFSYYDIKEKPLAGAESAFTELVNAFAELGHRVFVRNNCARNHVEENIDWRNLDEGLPPSCDFYIVNRAAALLTLVPKGKLTFFWLHNAGKYLLRFQSLKFLFRYYPTLVYSGTYHRSSFPLWFLFKSGIIPYGISSTFLTGKSFSAPTTPKAIFTSNPLRSLDWLIDRWIVVQRSVPNAELHVFSGSSTYGSWGKKVKDRMTKPLEYAKQHADQGVFVHEPLRKENLIDEIRNSRAMLYRGDLAETFCLAIAECQVMGLPCVVQDLGSMKERVVDGLTGYVTNSDRDFEKRSIEILSDDQLWTKMHRTLIEGKFHNTWKESAQMFINKANA